MIKKLAKKLIIKSIKKLAAKLIKKLVKIVSKTSTKKISAILVSIKNIVKSKKFIKLIIKDSLDK